MESDTGIRLTLRVTERKRDGIYNKIYRDIAFNHFRCQTQARDENQNVKSAYSNPISAI